MKFAQLKLNHLSAIKEKGEESRLPLALNSLCQGPAVLIVWSSRCLTHTGPELMCFPQTPPFPDASPAFHVNYYLSLGLCWLFFFLVELRGERNISYTMSLLKIKRVKTIPRESCASRKMRVEAYFSGEEKNILSCVSCKQGILEKMQLNTLFWNSWLALLTTVAWQALYWLCSSLGRQWAWDLPGSVQLSPLPGRRTAPFCPMSLTTYLEWSRPSLYSGLILSKFKTVLQSSRSLWQAKMQWNSTPLSVNYQKSFNSWHYYKLYTIMTGTVGLSVFLALHWSPKQCRLVGEKDLDALGGKLGVYMGDLCWPQQPVGL